MAHLCTSAISDGLIVAYWLSHLGTGGKCCEPLTVSVDVGKVMAYELNICHATINLLCI
jgi:hypothetical protein